MSISRLPPGRPRRAPQRVRLSRGSLLVQTAQPQPMHGTPTLVPVPSRMNWPSMLVVDRDFVISGDNMRRMTNDQAPMTKE